MLIEEWMIAYPKVSILIISFLVTLVMTLVTKKFTDQNRMKELKKIQKACQIKIKDAKGDMQKQAKINQEVMACTMELMKHSFKPMLITMIPIILLFSWVSGVYTAVLKGWFWWYFGGAIVSSIALRKVLDVA
ncbi:MAG TPA: EMC3/TMCO1 family protein [Candidatus Nanoarchaeia archaeon]|nr:EMC3/TMCO1 family protein [Candidatus Nanoarchaeia archaeon]